jgi:hypothetical protein
MSGLDRPLLPRPRNHPGELLALLRNQDDLADVASLGDEPVCVGGSVEWEGGGDDPADPGCVADPRVGTTAPYELAIVQTASKHISVYSLEAVGTAASRDRGSAGGCFGLRMQGGCIGLPPSARILG